MYSNAPSRFMLQRPELSADADHEPPAMLVSLFI